LESTNRPRQSSRLLSGFFLLFLLQHLHAVAFPASRSVEAPSRYFISPQARKAYQAITAMRFAEARGMLWQIKQEEPGNAIVVHLENYMDCIAVYVHEDPDAFHRLKQQKRHRLELLSAVEVSNPYSRFAQADMRMQWAMAHLKFGEYTAVFTEVSKAHKLLRANELAFPGFLPQQKNIALLQAIAGVIPDQYKWGFKLLTGLEGTILGSKRAFEAILQKSQHTDYLFETETRVLYSLLLLHLANDGEGAWRVANSFQHGDNPLHAFITVHVAMRSGHNEEALQILEKCPRGAPFTPLPFLDYLHGHAKLRRLDPDAHKYFLAFLHHYKGRNFIKDALQKLAWHSLIQGDERRYRSFMNRCQLEGFQISGSDRSAMKEAESGEIPQQILLRARLLFDGAYFQQSLSLLKAIRPEELPAKQHRLEYTYRMGRILHALERYEEALGYYKRVFQEGREDASFFACNARLQAGLIYEHQRKLDQARACFQDCLGMNSDEYEAEMHQKAKSGLNRLRNAK
jgi:tetratricopeptide (TPR) repeat protein